MKREPVGVDVRERLEVIDAPELVGNLGQTAETLREYLMGVKGSDLRAQATAEAGLLESLTALKVLEPEFGLNFNDEFGTYDCNTCNHGTTFGQPASTVRHAPVCAVIALRRHYRAALAQSGGEL